jgi:hypothetical protein
MKFDVVKRSLTIDKKKAGTKIKVIKFMLQLNNTKEVSPTYGWHFKMEYKDMTKELENVFIVPAITIPVVEPTGPTTDPEIPGSSTTDPAAADTGDTADTAADDSGSTTDGTASSTGEDSIDEPTKTIDDTKPGSVSGDKGPSGKIIIPG